MDGMLTHDTFTKFLNAKFKVAVDNDQQVELQLDEVSELRMSDHQEQFSILFRGPNETFLGQGIRHLSHERLGDFDLFLVPISQDAQGYCYESVFNRIRSRAEKSEANA